MDKRYLLLGGLILIIIGFIVFRLYQKPYVPKEDKKTENDKQVELSKEEKLTKDGIKTSKTEDKESVILGFTQTLYFASYYKSNYDLVSTNIDENFYPINIRSLSNEEKGKYIVDLITNGKGISKVTTSRTVHNGDSSRYQIIIAYFDKSTLDLYELELKNYQIVDIKLLKKDYK